MEAGRGHRFSRKVGIWTRQYIGLLKEGIWTQILMENTERGKVRLGFSWNLLELSPDLITVQGSESGPDLKHNIMFEPT